MIDPLCVHWLTCILLHADMHSAVRSYIRVLTHSCLHPRRYGCISLRWYTLVLACAFEPWLNIPLTLPWTPWNHRPYVFFTHAYNYVSCASTSVSRNAIMWRVIQPRSHIPAHVYTRVLVYPYTLTPRYVWIAWSQPHYSQIHASRFVYTHTVRTLYELASTKSGAHNMRSSIIPHLGPGAERLRVHTESRMSIHKRTDACHQMCLTRLRHLHTLVHSSFHITLHA